MTARDFIRFVANLYEHQPDDYVVSIGHWTQMPGWALPEFYADVKTTAGELRKMAS
jgi:hypothetical protein